MKTVNDKPIKVQTTTDSSKVVNDTPYKVTVVGGGGEGDGAVQSVNGKTGDVVLDKDDIGLDNVDNTSDANKPVSVAMQSALSNKVDGSTSITVGTTPPASPELHDIWVDTN